MAINQTFPEPSPVIASYNYTDIAEGTGIVVFYGYTTESPTEEYNLGTSVFYSKKVETISSVFTSGSWGKKLDVDFDLSPFNYPKSIRGDAIVSITSGYEGSGAGASEAYVIARIRKWDGSTETEIASGQGETKTIGGGGAETQLDLIKITVPKTHFKKGETLRLTIECYGKTTTASNTEIGFAHDPKERTTGRLTSGAETRVLQVNIPFDLVDI